MMTPTPTRRNRRPLSATLAATLAIATCHGEIARGQGREEMGRAEADDFIGFAR